MGWTKEHSWVPEEEDDSQTDQEIAEARNGPGFDPRERLRKVRGRIE